MTDHAEALLPDVWDNAQDDGHYALLKYQQDANDVILEHDVVVWEKSRRIGASWGISWVAVLVASLKATEGGMDVFYMGFEKDMTRQFVSDTGDHARLIEIAASDLQEDIFTDPDKDMKVFRIDFASRHEVLGLPSVARAFRSKQGLVIIDEAAFIDDLAAVLKAAFALLIWGGKIVIISSHNGDANPFNELCQDIRAGKKPDYKLIRTTFDDALADGLYKRICLKKGETWTAEGEREWRAKIVRQYGDNADEELFCIPNPSTGAFLSLALIEKCQTPDAHVVRWACDNTFALLPEDVRKRECLHFCSTELLPLLDQLDPKLAHVLGEDFGRSGDLTVLWPLTILANLTRKTPFTVELRNVPFEQQKQILWFVLDRLPRFRAAKLDARGNGQWLAEVTVQRYGSRVEAVMLTEGWYRDNMPPFKAAFEDGMLLVPADSDTQDDLRSLKIVRGVARIPETRSEDKTGKRHGDAAIAAAMAYAASRAEPEEYGYRAARSPYATADGTPAVHGWGVQDEIAHERSRRGTGLDSFGLRGGLS
ncbi:hypothetical protein [Neokomagataea anthophila]|uniref:hypothetical protein n=1 Tax=Neokomagataea anthophila TaxID=2826925 RepID=UPI002011DAB1|nr:hypothetical protein [Neokomagataea anthophila]